MRPTIQASAFSTTHQCVKRTHKVFIIKLQYKNEKKLLLERPKDTNEYKPLERILVSVDSEAVDAFIEELQQFPLIATKKHA